MAAAVTLASSGDLLAPEMLARLARLSLLARRMANARNLGRRRTRRVGSGIETIDLRAYEVGDDTRRIAWHAYARLEKLLIRLVADEAPLRLTLVVDQSSSMKFGELPKLRQAARIMAGFAAVALGGDDRVALAAGSKAGIRAHRAVSGRAGLPRLLATLDSLEASDLTDMVTTVRTALEAAPGRGVCLIASDLFEPQGILAGAKEARRRGHDVVIVEVLTPFEVAPPDLGGFELEDDETGEIIELPEHGVLEGWAKALETHRKAVDDAATSMGAVVLRATTAEAFETIVMRALGSGVLGSK